MDFYSYGYDDGEAGAPLFGDRFTENWSQQQVIDYIRGYEDACYAVEVFSLL